MESNGQYWLEKAKQSAGWLVFFGIVEVVAGFLSIGSPFMAGIAVTIMVGVALLIAGGARVGAAFMADSFGAGALAVLWGLVIAATGFYIIIRPGIGLESLTLVVAMALFLAGILRTLTAFKLKPVNGWGWMLVSGILDLLFSMMIGWQFPASSLWVIGTLVGVSLLFGGFTTITLAGTARKAAGIAEQAL